MRWTESDHELFLDDIFFEVDDASQIIARGAGRGQGLLTRAFIVAVGLSFAIPLSDRPSGVVSVCLADRGDPTMISFTGRSDHASLIPDPEFIRTLAYERFKRITVQRWIPWSERHPRAIWRGTLNGPIGSIPTDDWSWLPRARLCAVAEEIERSNAIDAKLTGISEFVANRFGTALTGVTRFLGPAVDPMGLIQYRYMIDIDGWANAWSGLFQKLLTGSTVLKVASQAGFRQWYYERLEPWTHFVPVNADLSDLDQALEFVLENDGKAEAIGRAGRQLALSLALEPEIFFTSSVLKAAAA